MISTAPWSRCSTYSVCCIACCHLLITTYYRLVESSGHVLITQTAEPAALSGSNLVFCLEQYATPQYLNSIRQLLMSSIGWDECVVCLTACLISFLFYCRDSSSKFPSYVVIVSLDALFVGVTDLPGSRRQKPKRFMLPRKQRMQFLGIRRPARRVSHHMTQTTTHICRSLSGEDTPSTANNADSPMYTHQSYKRHKRQKHRFSLDVSSVKSSSTNVSDRTPGDNRVDKKSSHLNSCNRPSDIARVTAQPGDQHSAALGRTVL